MEKETRTSAAERGKALAAPRPATPWVETPAVQAALRVGTAALMCMAAMLVLLHLNVYSKSLMSPDQTETQRASACFLNGCP